MKISLTTSWWVTSPCSSTASSASPTPSTSPYTAGCRGLSFVSWWWWWWAPCHNSLSLSDILNCCRQFRTTFRALFLNPIQGWCAGCRQGPGEPIPDQETTTAMGTKSRSDQLKSSFYTVVIIQKSQQCLNRFRNDLLSPSLIGPFSKFSFTYSETSHDFCLIIEEKWWLDNERVFVFYLLSVDLSLIC